MTSWYSVGATGERVLDVIEYYLDNTDEYQLCYNSLRRIGLTSGEAAYELKEALKELQGA